MANFSITAPVDLAANLLILQGSSQFSHTAFQRASQGSDTYSFSNNAVMSPNNINYTTGYSFPITTPYKYTLLDARPTIGQLYPR